jgi:hypothetical protein
LFSVDVRDEGIGGFDPNHALVKIYMLHYEVREELCEHKKTDQHYAKASVRLLVLDKDYYAKDKEG